MSEMDKCKCDPVNNVFGSGCPIHEHKPKMDNDPRGIDLNALDELIRERDQLRAELTERVEELHDWQRTCNTQNGAIEYLEKQVAKRDAVIEAARKVELWSRCRDINGKRDWREFKELMKLLHVLFFPKELRNVLATLTTGAETKSGEKGETG